MKNIILIGFMGVGKGTVARAFAKKYEDFYAIDTDDLIESLENRKIKKIFEEDGEPYFRALEAKTADWLTHSVQNAIISTGGGFYKQERLKEIGTVVLLDSCFDAILARILAHPNAKRKLAKRPLFSSPEQARALFEEREKAYRLVADIVVNVEGRHADDIAQEIRKKTLELQHG
jgi:shikimate kinase